MIEEKRSAGAVVAYASQPQKDTLECAELRRAGGLYSAALGWRRAGGEAGMSVLMS